MLHQYSRRDAGQTQQLPYGDFNICDMQNA